MTSSDRLAAVVYSVAAELRLRIGQDLAVTGFDGTAAASLMHPRLTSVVIPVDDIARRVVARALRQIDHGPDQDPGEVVPVTLRAGESTGRLSDRPGGERGASRTLDGPAARGDHDAALTWKRFQGTALPPGTSTLAGGDLLPAESPRVRRVTIADVAADAGVGVGTVSRVVNGGEQVRASTMRAVLDSIDRLGYRPVAIPEQLSLVGFDDIESAAFLGLSTVRQPLAASGAEGARRLCALLRGERVYPLRQELPIDLVARGSSASYPG